MKQKLLNSFTWRATLLVALLCTSFGNAWGEDYTEQITLASDVSIAAGGEQIFSTKITGYFIGIIINCTAPNSGNGNGNNYNVTANVFGTNVINKTNTTTTNFEYGATQETFGEDKTISVTVKNNSKNKKMTVNSITVTYTPAAIIKINSACKCQYDNLYYGTFSNSSPFVVPGNADFTVSEVSVSGGILDVNPLSGTQTVTISANTGVLVSSETAGEKIVKLADPDPDPAPEEPYIEPENNMLHPSSEAMTSIEDYSDYYFYHLTFNTTNPLGFYWGHQDDPNVQNDYDGGPWTFSGSNKAYLAVPKTDSYSVKGFTMSDSADGIKAIETEKNSEMVFNLAGQRVSKMQKGIYVVNGKKILVK